MEFIKYLTGIYDCNVNFYQCLKRIQWGESSGKLFDYLFERTQVGVANFSVSKWSLFEAHPHISEVGRQRGTAVYAALLQRSGKEAVLPSPPPLRTARETFASSSSSLSNAPFRTRFHFGVFLVVKLLVTGRM